MKDTPLILLIIITLLTCFFNIKIIGEIIVLTYILFLVVWDVTKKVSINNPSVKKDTSDISDTDRYYE
jgi:uncharacterized transporter YbjL